ncbi:hypothetical protein HK105_203399 [Polyrhizophydium stewartii]|uniref:ribonuclease Z n=1 Tax=Polyrhizophydium stewartii TaxID=2732419 RepID=A0ABR4NBV5_9FUNG
MRYSLQVVSTHTGDSAPSVMLHFDSARYLFNCGEGTQRICNQHKLRLGKLRTIFLTRTRWSCFGGLPGMLLTLADAGISAFELFGPRNTSYTLAAARRFVRRPNIRVAANDVVPVDFHFRDENLSVRAVELRPTPRSPALSPAAGRKRKSAEALEDPASSHRPESYRQFLSMVISRMFPSADEGQSPAAGLEAAGIWKQLAALGYSWDSLPPVEDTGVALCYVCQGPEAIGKMDAAIALKLGVKRGPDMGKLKAGQSVVAMDGSIVHPSQCVEPNKPGPIFIIADCPSTDYIDSLVSEPTLSGLAGATGDDAVHCIVHMCGDGVMLDQRFRSWMASFPSKTQHIFISRCHNQQPVVFTSSAEIQHKLNALDENVFPLPFVAPKPSPLSVETPKNLTAAEMLLSYYFAPAPKFDSSECLPEFAPSTSTPEYAAFLDQAEIAKSSITLLQDDRASSESESSSQDPLAGVSVTPLGTGSAIPGKYRNVHQLASESQKKLVVVAPISMWKWLQEMSYVQDIGMERLIYVDSNNITWHPGHLVQQRVNQTLLDLTGLSSLNTVHVDHCSGSFALVGQTKQGFKFAFSGDCRPSENFAKAGCGSHLLIHEATLDDDMQAEAVKKKHCTIREAIQVGTAMQAQNLLLTHFSQRYPKLPNVDAAPSDGNNPAHLPTIGVAFDLMTVPMPEFWKLPHMVPALQALFPKEEDDSDGIVNE